VFSGGDDCKLKCHDLRAGSPAFVIKEHTMGVTSLLSDARQEFRLFSGSYDENLHFWDTRCGAWPRSYPTSMN
jgi:WD40 repeat protein